MFSSTATGCGYKQFDGGIVWLYKQTMNDDESPNTPELDEKNEPSPDPDREAILARRQRFIAIALSGFTSALAGCDHRNEPPKPPIDQQGAVSSGAPTGNSGAPSRSVEGGVPPQPCLKMVPPQNLNREEQGAQSEQSKPQPCLSIARPSDEKMPTRKELEQKMREHKAKEAPPQVCLSIVPPQNDREP